MFEGSRIQAEAWDEVLKYCNGDDKKALKIWNETAQTARERSTKENKVLLIKARQFGMAGRIKLDKIILKALEI